jgi:hypothetical protein
MRKSDIDETVIQDAQWAHRPSLRAAQGGRKIEERKEGRRNFGLFTYYFIVRKMSLIKINKIWQWSE